MEIIDKEFFRPGDCVTLRQDIPFKPTMIVVRKETNMLKSRDSFQNTLLKGIKCRWFTKDGLLQEASFNTKDLIKV